MTVFNIVNSRTNLQQPRQTFAGFGRAVGLHTFTAPQEASIGASHLVLTAQNWESTLAGHGVTSSESIYVAVGMFFGQALKTDQLYLVLASAKVAQAGDLTVGEAVDGDYSVTIGEDTFTHAAVGQTDAQIATALAALIDADPKYTASATLAVVSYSIDQAGISETVATSSPNNLLTHTLTTPAVGYVEDLLAFMSEVTTDFWAILETARNEAENLKLARWASTQIEKVAFVYTTSANAQTTGNTDHLGAEMKARNLEGGAAFYGELATEFFEWGLVGGNLPKTPGSLTWHMQPVIGALGIIPTNRAALEENFYTWNEEFASVTGAPTASQEGRVASGHFIDEIRGRHAFDRDLRESKFHTFRNLDKVTYDEDGVDILVGCLINVVERWDANGFVDADTLEITTIPVKDIPSDIRGTRCYYGISYSVKLKGAIHKLANPSGGPGIEGDLYA